MSEFMGYVPEDLGKVKVENNPEKIDKELNDKYMELRPGEDYEYLDGNLKFRSQQFEKAKSGNGDIELDYVKLEDFSALNEKEKELIALKESLRIKGMETRFIENKIEKDDTNVKQEIILKNTYRWKINEDLAVIRMLRCTHEGQQARKKLHELELGNNTQIDSEKKQLFDIIKNADSKFDRYSNFIYGEPQKELFDYFRFQILDKCDRAREADYPEEIKEIAGNLKADLSKDIDKLDKNKLYENIPHVDTEDKNMGEKVTLQPEEFKTLMEYGLQEINANTEWKVVIDDKKTGLSVNQKEKTVAIPNKTREELKEKIKALIMHEIGTHVQRRNNGEMSKLTLLGPGLDRYIRGEEAAATYNEQKILGFDEFAGTDGILAIGLVKGMDSIKNKSEKTEDDYRNCLELYNILVNYYTLTQFEKMKDVNKAKEKAHDMAKNRCIRTFRGVNDLQNKKGICLGRDVIYSENMNLWRIIKNDGFEEEKIFLGKFDPVNERHNFILSVLGISDNNLENIK